MQTKKDPKGVVLKHESDDCIVSWREESERNEIDQPIHRLVIVLMDRDNDPFHKLEGTKRERTRNHKVISKAISSICGHNLCHAPVGGDRERTRQQDKI